MFDDEIASRHRTAHHHEELLSNIKTSWIAPDRSSVYAQYTIELPTRETVQATLKEHGIPITVHYPVPLHIQPAFADRAEAADHLTSCE